MLPLVRTRRFHNKQDQNDMGDDEDVCVGLSGFDSEEPDVSDADNSKGLGLIR